MAKTPKTNVARLLERDKIAHKLVTYEVDENNLAATHVAEVLGEDVERVFKTLVLNSTPTGHIVCVIPGDKEIDLKKAARAAGMKKVEMLPLKELLPLTGYIRGACSPIGMKKPLPTFIHQTATDFDEIFVSAGQRGLQLCINPSDLITFVGATIADLIKDV